MFPYNSYQDSTIKYSCMIDIGHELLIMSGKK